MPSHGQQLILTSTTRLNTLVVTGCNKQGLAQLKMLSVLKEAVYTQDVLPLSSEIALPGVSLGKAEYRGIIRGKNFTRSQEFSLCQPLVALRCSVTDALQLTERKAGTHIEMMMLCQREGRVDQGLNAVQVGGGRLS